MFSSLRILVPVSHKPLAVGRFAVEFSHVVTHDVWITIARFVTCSIVVLVHTSWDPTNSGATSTARQEDDASECRRGGGCSGVAASFGRHS